MLTVFQVMIYVIFLLLLYIIWTFGLKSSGGKKYGRMTLTLHEAVGLCSLRYHGTYFTINSLALRLTRPGRLFYASLENVYHYTKQWLKAPTQTDKSELDS